MEEAEATSLGQTENIPESLPNVCSETLGLGNNDVDKNQLLQICRLCARGSQGNDTNEELGTTSWISLLEKYPNGKETVREVLRQCIPSVLMINLPNENICNIICASCFSNLKSIKSFFELIAEGQRILAKAVKNLDFCVKAQVDSPLTETANLPKRRGRPRKSAKLAELPQSTDQQTDVQEIEPRTRRSTRIPKRYEDDFCLNAPNVPPTDKCNTEIQDAKSVDLPKDHDHGASENTNLEHRNTDTVLEMDKEEGLSSTIGKCLPELPAEGTNQKEKVSSGETVETDAPGSDDELTAKSDSDVSVKMGDLIRGRKLGKRRKRGRPKLRKKREFICELCEKIYHTQSALIYHKLSVHENKRDFQCNLCKKTFCHKGLLTNHMFTHYSEKSFSCDECNASFKNRNGLYSHKRMVHIRKKEKQFTCEKCGLQFTMIASLRAHIRIHTGEKPYKCRFCEKKFTHRGNLAEHTRIHTKEKPYLWDAPECGKRFTTSSQLRTHKLIHDKSKSLLCVECGKEFGNKENLKCHMKRHNAEKSMECSSCHQKFADTNALKKHRRIHTGERPYQCSICSKAFTDRSNFSKHLKIHPQNSVENRTDSPSSKSVIVSTDKMTPTTESTVNITENPEHEETGGTLSIEPIVENLQGSELVTEGETLVQILNPETFAALSGGSDGTDGNIIYLYQPEDGILSVSVDDHQTVEITNDTMTLHEVIGDLGAHNDEALQFSAAAEDSIVQLDPSTSIATTLTVCVNDPRITHPSDSIA